MANPPASAINGEELRKRAVAETLRIRPLTSVQVEQSPLVNVMRNGEMIQAAKISALQTTSLDADTLEAENKRIELELRNQELKDARAQASNHSSGQSSGGWQDYILHMLEDTRGQLAAAQADNMARQEKLLDVRLQMLQAENERLQAQTAVVPLDPVQAMDATLDAADRITERAEKRLAQRTPPPQAQSPDYQLQVLLAEIEVKREMMRIDADKAARDWQKTYDLERERLDREQKRLDRDAETHNRFLELTVPRGLAIAEKFADPIIMRFFSGAPPAPAGSPALGEVIQRPHQHAPPPVPDGLLAFQCVKCHNRILYRPGATELICSNCGESFLYRPEGAQGAQENLDGLSLGAQPLNGVPDPIPGLVAEEEQ